MPRPSRKARQPAELPRHAAKAVAGAARQFPVLLLTGARQVGKTTLLRALASAKRRYVTLDDPLQLRLAREDPALFLQSHPPPVLIDEVQYAPQILPHIKMAVDARRRAGDFWLTGSQPFHLMQGVSESLAGRVAVLQLHGLSRREALRLAPLPPFLPTAQRLRKRQLSAVPADLQTLYAAIWRGSYPALVAQPSMSRDLFYSSYLQTYLQRDVRDLARVGDQSAFLRLLRAAAARTAQLLNMAELARDADVAPNTAKSWLAILEASGVVSLLQPWHTNLSKRLVKTPKLHFLDTGLAAYLTQWNSPETLQAGAMGGAVFESWVYGEILRSHSHAASTAPMYYFRDKDQREVDLLIEADGLLHPVECKRSASPGRDVVAGMRALANAGAPVGPGAVVCMVAEPVPLQAEPRVTALPAWVL
jgi:hypothetical protein